MASSNKKRDSFLKKQNENFTLDAEKKKRHQEIINTRKSLQVSFIDLRRQGLSPKDGQFASETKAIIDFISPSKAERKHLLSYIKHLESRGALKPSQLEDVMLNLIQQYRARGKDIAADPQAQNDLIRELQVSGQFSKQFLKQELSRLIQESSDFVTESLEQVSLMLEELYVIKRDRDTVLFMLDMNLEERFSDLLKRGEKLKKEILRFMEGKNLIRWVTMVQEMFGTAWSQEGKGSAFEYMRDAREFAEDLNVFINLKEGILSIKDALHPSNGDVAIAIKEVKLKLGELPQDLDKSLKYEERLSEYATLSRDLSEAIDNIDIYDFDEDDMGNMNDSIVNMLENIDDMGSELDEDLQKSEDYFYLDKDELQKESSVKLLAPLTQNLENKTTAALAIIDSAIAAISQDSDDHKKLSALRDLKSFINNLDLDQYRMEVLYFEDAETKSIYIDKITGHSKLLKLRNRLKEIKKAINKLDDSQLEASIVDSFGRILDNLGAVVLGAFLSSTFERNISLIMINYGKLDSLSRTLDRRDLTITLKILKQYGKADLKLDDHTFLNSRTQKMEDRKIVKITKSERTKLRTNIGKI